METKHTKGEWRRGFINGFVIMSDIDTEKKEIAKICFDIKDEKYYPKITESIANAKLIAAAPELLEALIEIIKTCNPKDVTPHKKYMGLNLGEFYVGGCGIPSDKAVHMAINAINKATK